MKGIFISCTSFILGFLLITLMMIAIKYQKNYENIDFALDHSLKITFEDYRKLNYEELIFDEVIQKFTYYFKENLNNVGEYTINIMGFNHNPWLLRVNIKAKFKSLNTMTHTVSVDRTVIMEGINEN